MSSRLPLLAIVLLVAGCGGKTTTVVKTVTQPVPTATETTATETTAPTTTETTTEAEPATNSGSLGTAFVLRGSPFSHVPPGKTRGPRDRIKVKLTEVVDPIAGYDIGKRQRLIGLRMTVENVGKTRYVDFQPSGDLTIAGGGVGKPQSLITTGEKVCDNPSLKLKPGDSGEACMAFLVPKAAKLQSFTYSPGLDGDDAVWKF